MAKILMVQGTMSNVGKSLIVAGLCRVFSKDGYKVAPFKSQNMALNSFVTYEGLEIGRAQAMQAEAAGILPSVDMNPILLKPTGNSESQVIVKGSSIGNMTAKEYFDYKEKLIPDIQAAFDNLAKENDIIVIEGAGSPAEINLRDKDIVNMGLAEMLDAPVVLVGDIDRGGVFAQLLGTYMLLSEEERSRLVAVVINKFRGDKTLLDPGIDMLQEKMPVPVAGVLPYIKLKLEDEDSLTERFTKTNPGALINISVIRLPWVSNFTDLDVFEQFDEVEIRYINGPGELTNADMVVIPGSKNTISDLRWLREVGLDREIIDLAHKGIPIFGICGGYQILGETISDPHEVEEGGKEKGLGLLPVDTVLEEKKRTKQYVGEILHEGIFEGLSGLKVEGYEIHMGSTEVVSGNDNPNWQQLRMFTSDGTGVSMDNVFGTYIHGLFDAEGIAGTIVEQLAHKKGVKVNVSHGMSRAAFKEEEFNKLEQMIRDNLDLEYIYKVLR